MEKNIHAIEVLLQYMSLPDVCKHFEQFGTM